MFPCKCHGAHSSGFSLASQSPRTFNSLIYIQLSHRENRFLREFDPVLFPEAETMDPVISHTSYNHGDYRSTELPDEDTWIEKGGYGFEDNHITNFFNFVGFA